jgi:7,8-dihydroneopterin aldolase/epimerase/oxygenase
LNSSPADKIFLRGLVVHARIGEFGRADVQSLQVELEAGVDLARAAASDDLSETVNYAELARLIAETLAKSAHASLGGAASFVAEAILLSEHRIREVQLTLHNSRIVLARPVDQIAVTVVRSRC